jgi:hypothetical protein
MEEQASAELPGPELSHDRVLRPYDMEGPHVRHQIRVTSCSCIKVIVCMKILCFNWMH